MALLYVKMGLASISSQVCELLGDIYSWFTEEFATVDLIEAKVLLEKLGELADPGQDDC